MTSSASFNFNAATNHRFLSGLPYTEERSRWSVLQALDCLGYIPVVAVAIGTARVAGSIFVLLGTGIVYAGASYYEDQTLKSRCFFIAQRAVGEIGRGLGQEILLFGVSSIFYDLFRRSFTRHGNLDDQLWARGPVFRIDTDGCIHYPCGSEVSPEYIPNDDFLRAEKNFRNNRGSYAAHQPAAEANSTATYTILQLEPNASIDQIKKAYKELAIKYHPDKQCLKQRNESQEAYDARIAVSKAKFLQISEAYEALKVSRNFS